MPVTMEQVLAALGSDEPDYDSASRLGPEALPHLNELVLSGDPEMASKAASLAGVIAAAGSEAVLQAAARSANPVVRVAAAGAAGNLPVEEASGILVGLIADDDRSVRQVALESIPTQATEELRSRVAQLREGDPVPQIRELADDALHRLSG
jgi:HEAT repeat protein